MPKGLALKMMKGLLLLFISLPLGLQAQLHSPLTLHHDTLDIHFRDDARFIDLTYDGNDRRLAVFLQRFNDHQASAQPGSLRLDVYGGAIPGRVAEQSQWMSARRAESVKEIVNRYLSGRIDSIITHNVDTLWDGYHEKRGMAVLTYALRQQQQPERVPVASSSSAVEQAETQPVAKPARMERKPFTKAVRTEKQPAPKVMRVAHDTVVSDSHYHTELSTNLLYLATGTPNITLDFGIGRRWSLSLTSGYNPWKYGSYTNDKDETINPKTMHWLVMPELRFWFREHLLGGYIALHGVYADYNVGGVKLFRELERHRYAGHLWGWGATFGWHWWLGRKHRTGMNAYVGIGYVRLVYDQYKACHCGARIEEYERSYLGPTRLGLSLTYRLK